MINLTFNCGLTLLCPVLVLSPWGDGRRDRGRDRGRDNNVVQIHRRMAVNLEYQYSGGGCGDYGHNGRKCTRYQNSKRGRRRQIVYKYDFYYCLLIIYFFLSDNLNIIFYLLRACTNNILRMYDRLYKQYARSTKYPCDSSTYIW